ncbi:MAG: NAD-dependent epimerase/dehydratase family protein [Planctomycetota bacterium]|jgi:UDP-glucuronate 4-epimerase
MILLTGAAGFIGSHLADRLLELGEQVVGLDNFDDYYDPEVKRRNISAALKNPGFRLVEADISDREALAAVFAEKQFDAVVHMAARAGVRLSVVEPGPYIRVNVTGTVNVLEAGRAGGVTRFVLASSSSVYGLGTPAPFREDAPCDRQVSPYAASKRAMEHFARTWHELHGLDVACLRYFTVYGPRQRPEMAIHKFARLIEQGEPIPVFGDGKSGRDYTFISDAVDGTLGALYRSRGYGVYNIGESRVVRLAELIGLIESALGKKAVVDRQPDQPGDVPLTSADVTLSGEKIGYRPSVSMEEGLERFVKWLRSGGGE